MADAQPAQGNQAHAAHGAHESHASVGFYWMIAAVLGVITGMEVAIFYIPAVGAALVPALLLLSATKFLLVVMFFMHLKFDSWWFGGLFLAGLTVAIFLVTALVVLYYYVPRFPHLMLRALALLALPQPLHAALPPHDGELDELVLGGFEVHPSVLIGCALLAAAYAWAVGPGARRWGWAEVRAERWRVWCWALGLAVVFLSLDGPLHELADEYLFSAHMTQHLLLMLIMPPLLILGLPPALVRRTLRARLVLGVGRTLTHPVVAFTAYNVVFVGWHFPAAYGAALEHHALHIVQHLMFMSVAVMMWWPVIAPVPELERVPDGPMLMLYVFAFGIPSTILSAFITMSDGLFYPFYAAAPRITALSPLQDQRLGGLLMWVPGMLVFWIAISAVWFRWTREEYVEWKQEARAAAAART